MSSYISYMEEHGHEQVALFADSATGLKGAIAVHDTTLGPSLGGVRIWSYKTEEDAVMDVLRLSEAMTLKSAAAGLDLGGGKAVIMASSGAGTTESLMRSFGRQVASLDGRYVTTEDVGTTAADVQWIAKETSYVAGLPVESGGSGDPSPMTSYGLYQGILATAQYLWGSDDLSGMRIVIQGLGKVGNYLLPYLKGEGAIIIGSDLDSTRVERAQSQYGLVPIDPDDVYGHECDIFVPCALGGILNDDTIPLLKAKAVCGSANNQLLEPRHADAMAERDILYAPDYIVNAGGVINISFEIDRTYSAEEARRKTGQIYNTVTNVFNRAKDAGISTDEAARIMAQNRIDSVRNIRMPR